MAGKPARTLAIEVIAQARRSNEYVDVVLERTLARSRLDERERALLLELVNGTVRQRGYLNWILAQFYAGQLSQCPVHLQTILEVCLYQLVFLDSVPSYAAVSEGVELAKRKGGQKWAGLVNAVLRNYLRRRDEIVPPAIADDPVSAIAVRYSHPEWIVRRWLERWGQQDTIAYCEYNNRRPEIAIRVNPLRANPEDVRRALEAAGLEVTPSAYWPDFLRLRKLADISNNSLFQQGAFAIQDESTAVACRLLSPEPGDVVLDMCAAPGGKACYLAQMMRNRGRVIALDISPKRLERVAENARRLGVTIVDTRVGDAREVDALEVDKILIDAPCSGLGVLARRADLRWRRKPEDVATIRDTQTALLANAARLLRPDGVLVYSTCTLEPEETAEVMERFLAEHAEFELDSGDAVLPNVPFRCNDGAYRTLPFRHAIDGSYSVRLKKQTTVR